MVDAPPANDIRKGGWKDRQPLGEHVAKVIGNLQGRYCRRESDALATLARLRNVASADLGIGSVPEACWLPAELLEPKWNSDAPSPSERALHSAVTTWAVHQQSISDHRMHQAGTTFAQAVQRLALRRRSEGRNEDTIHERFLAVGAVVTFAELMHDVRGLVKQLRDERIGFDYGIFADDLRTFQDRTYSYSGQSGPERVRDKWGREYWRSKPDGPTPAGDATAAADTDDHHDDEDDQE
jgi:CRISPR system Cascade subunit CasB